MVYIQQVKEWTGKRAWHVNGESLFLFYWTSAKNI